MKKNELSYGDNWLDVYEKGNDCYMAVYYHGKKAGYYIDLHGRNKDVFVSFPYDRGKLRKVSNATDGCEIVRIKDQQSVLCYDATDDMCDSQVEEIVEALVHNKDYTDPGSDSADMAIQAAYAYLENRR